ncbi:MAG: hypothetical protein ACRC3Y_17255 [Romboutsia sp.]|uniref:hypothetical protein n=1 Tax=Romboutsia sp. TaxID=1965302 RepID=UPI003F2ACD9B
MEIYVTHVNYKMSYYIDVKKTSTDATIVNSYGEQADAWLVASDVTYGIDTRLPKKVSMKLYFRDLSGSRTVRLNSNIINSGKTLNVQWIR